MATQQVYTETMAANAAQLLQTAYCWTRGVRKADGMAIVIFPSGSNPKVGHETTLDSCKCKGYQYRGVCSHLLAVRLDMRQAREEAVAVHEAACREAASGELENIYA